MDRLLNSKDRLFNFDIFSFFNFSKKFSTCCALKLHWLRFSSFSLQKAPEIIIESTDDKSLKLKSKFLILDLELPAMDEMSLRSCVTVKSVVLSCSTSN